MIYTILIAINVIFLIFIAFSLRRKNFDIKQMKKLSDEDFVRTLLPFARRLRFTERGNGANISSLYGKIHKAYLQIENKVKENKALYEYEKWFYENNYLVKRFIHKQKLRNFSSLPHSDKEVRIISLARFIVNNSLGCLDFSRLDLAMNTIKNELSLCYGEIIQFNNAIGFALIEQIYILAERIIFHNNCKSVAERDYVVKKRLNSDIYNYFLLKNKEINIKAVKEMNKIGIDPQSIPYNYNLSLVESTNMAKCLFMALMKHETFISENLCLNYMNTDRILNVDNSYQNLSFNTKKSYYEIIEKISENLNVSEIMVANKLLELAKFNEINIGSILYDYTYCLKRLIKHNKLSKIPKIKKSISEIGYVFAILFSTVTISFGLYLIFENVIAAIFGLLPIVFIVEKLFNTIISNFTKNRILPQMNYQKIPYEYNTLVVVSEYISSKKQLSEAINHLIELRESNIDNNINFAMLVDFKSGESEKLAIDEELLPLFDELKDKQGYNIFLRKRTKEGKKYVGLERKRGAIMALNRYLVTGNDDEFVFILNKNMMKPTFVMTLDSDNTLITGSVKEMINILAHPYNEKYDLINAHSKYNLYSIKSCYSKRFLYESGTDDYPIFSSFYYNLFGKDIFCGKGLYRLRTFYNKLEGILPSKKILSHDILEGAILNCGSGATIFEDAPESFLSERDRKKRWMRGDIQLLPFVRKSWKNDYNEKYKSNINSFYKYLIIRNGFSPLKELSMLIIGLLAIFVDMNLWNFFFILFLSPYIINEIKILQGLKNNTRIDCMIMRTFHNVYEMIEDFFMIVYYAIGNLYIFVKTLLRMIMKKNLLIWKTYYQSQKQKDFYYYIQEFLPVLISISIISFFSYLYDKFVIWILSYAILSFLWQMFMFILSKPIPTVNIDKKSKDELRVYAEKTYKYFKLMDTPNGIIGDNIQIKPFKGQSNKTSPTNIGYSLLAEISAYYLKFISAEEVVVNINKILNSIDKMQKWKGNLYNWYDINDFSLINKFVSSVDSGNLVACLMITKEFLESLKNDGAKLAIKLIYSTDLESLFDKSCNQFYLGFDEKTKKYEGHYDILASEARLLSLIYIALSGRCEHWRNLQRDYTPIGGNTLLSWSGTMFEYLMPDLFIKPPKSSLLFQTSKNIVDVQFRNKYKKLWGISESGYYKFDEELRYQYYAFGLNCLSLRSEIDKGIISPYSSVLALQYKPKAVIRNLRNISRIGALNDYGFYEAIDCSGEIRFISSYMTHHQGMIIVAIVNFLENNIFSKLLARNPEIKGAMNLLNERKSEYAYGYKVCHKPKKINSTKNEFYKYINDVNYRYQAFGLTNGSMSICYDILGNNFTKYNDIFINAYKNIFDEFNGGYFYVIDKNKKLYSPSYYPLQDKIEKYNVSYSDIEITLQNNEDGIREDICIADGINAIVKRLTFQNDNQKDIEIGYYMQLAINTYDGFCAHPNFNNLFINSFYDKTNNALIFQKRSIKKDGDLYVAFVVRGLKDIVVETNRFNILGRNGDESIPKYFLNNENEGIYPSMGDVLEPAVAFRGTFDNKENVCQIITLIAHNKEELNLLLPSLPEDFYAFAKESSRLKFKINAFTNEILGEILYARYSNNLLNFVVKNQLQKEFLGLNCNNKSVMFVYDDNKNENFVKLLKTINELKIFGFSVRLMIYYKENFKETQKIHIEDQLKSFFIRDYCIVEKTKENDILFNLAFVVIDSNLNFSTNKIRENIYRKIKSEPGKLKYYENLDTPIENAFYTGNGYFDNDKYILSRTPYLPYSNCICDKEGGFIITENGGGFYYFENSRENKSTRYDFDPVKDKSFESIYIKDKEGYYRINGGSGKNHKTIYSKGLNEHFCSYNGINSSVESYIILDGKIKVTEITIKKDRNISSSLEMVYAFEPSLNWNMNSKFISTNFEWNTISIHNIKNNKKLFIKAIINNYEDIIPNDINNEEYPYFELNLSESFPYKLFIISSMDNLLISEMNAENILLYKEKYLQKFKNINNIKFNTPIKSFNYLANNLLYQIKSSRLNGHCGYYQVGGATGFRDQLQDCLAFVNSEPDILKEQIIYCAIHQYEEGDVMHWWHHPNCGLRTRISDDKLFLPYCLSMYIDATKDFDILKIELPYIKSPELCENENTRYECPEITMYSETLLKHCLKAIKSSLRYGEHNILLMGGGDWNDGLDYAGIKGKGESVVLSMFCYKTIMMFKSYCDIDKKNELFDIAKRLKESVENFCFVDNQYKRLYSDDGKWYGAKNTPQYNIDLVAQSFSVLCDIAEDDRAKQAMLSAEKLIDYELGIIKLLYPPLTKDDFLGYISSYPKGIRENGGQYTHAVIWYIMSLIKIGEKEKAFDLFQMINPTEKCRDEIMNRHYQGEPYVLAGDVYSNKDNPGRMGWSWYTGSASWAYKLIIEEFFGVKKIKNKLKFSPNLPKKLYGSELELSYKSSKYIIKFQEGNRKRLLYDSLELTRWEIDLEDKKRSYILIELNE